MDIDAVTEILEEAAELAIVPRFGALADGDIMQKSAGEIVTVADREAEEMISPRLRALVDAPVIGEEATAASPGLLRALDEAPVAWVLDPLDGTANFVAGKPAWAVMAALVRAGDVVASWIVRPADRRVYVAEHGGGAWRNDVRIRRSPAPADPAAMRGAAHTRFLSPEHRATVLAARPRFAELGPGASCAGIDYPRLAEGELDFVLFWRTLPWDHAPGTLLVTEAGGVSRRPGGEPFHPAGAATGLLNAADERCWAIVRTLLLG